MEAAQLDWGEVTPEGFDGNRNQALHVLNVFLQNPEGRRLALPFLVGRVIWFQRHLPRGCSHRVRVDTGGQTIPVETLYAWRDEALSRIQDLEPAVRLEIEFLV